MKLENIEKAVELIDLLQNLKSTRDSLVWGTLQIVNSVGKMLPKIKDEELTQKISRLVEEKIKETEKEIETL